MRYVKPVKFKRHWPFLLHIACENVFWVYGTAYWNCICLSNSEIVQSHIYYIHKRNRMRMIVKMTVNFVISLFVFRRKKVGVMWKPWGRCNKTLTLPHNSKTVKLVHMFIRIIRMIIPSHITRALITIQECPFFELEKGRLVLVFGCGALVL